LYQEKQAENGWSFIIQINVNQHTTELFFQSKKGIEMLIFCFIRPDFIGYKILP
jgi:hypothetical protein